MFGKFLCFCWVIIQVYANFTPDDYLLGSKNQYKQKSQQNMGINVKSNILKNQGNQEKEQKNDKIASFQQSVLDDKIKTTKLEEQSLYKIKNTVSNEQMTITVFGKHQIVQNVVAQSIVINSDSNSKVSQQSLTSILNQQFLNFLETLKPSSNQPQTQYASENKAAPNDTKNGAVPDNISKTHNNIRFQNKQPNPLIDKNSIKSNNTQQNKANTPSNSNNVKMLNISKIQGIQDKNVNKTALPTILKNNDNLKIQKNTKQNIQSLSNYSNSSNFLKPQLQLRIPQIKKPSQIKTQTLVSPSSNLPISSNIISASINNLANNRSTIISKQFSNVGLFHQVPTNFTVGQYFKFNGIVLNSSLLISQGALNFNFLNIVFSAWGNINQFRCIQPITKRNLQFQISCKMEKQGRFFLSIFPGIRGQSSSNMRMIQNRTNQILKDHSVQAPVPKNLKLNIIDNFLVIEWDSLAALTNLTIYQNSTNNQNRKQFILSNYHTKFRISYPEFKNFQPGITYIEISHANSRDGTYCKQSSSFSKQILSASFEAIEHAFSSLIQDKVKIDPPIPWKLDVGKSMKFNAIFNEPVQNEVFITLPNKKLFTVWFIKPANSNENKRIISPGTSVSLQLTFSAQGTHIIQINAANGMALVNRPIYVGKGFPLLPDYQDLVSPSTNQSEITAPKKALGAYVQKTTSISKTVVQPPPSSSLNTKRQFLLQLLNALRKKHDARSLVLNQKLNDLAQSHSDDMDINNYFSHTNLKGEGPGQRAKKMAITTSVGQNIAKSNSLIQAHLSLQRSAVHLQNSIKKSWTRVGIGIVKSKIGQYIVSFQFSTRDLTQTPLSYQEIEKYREDVASLVRNNNAGIRFSKQMSMDIANWMQSPRSIDLLQSLVQQKNYKGHLSYTSFQMSYSDDWIDRLKTAGYLSSRFSSFNRFGIGLFMKKKDPNIFEGCAVFN